MIQTAPLEFIVTYNKYFHPGDGVSGCETADGKPLDGPKCKTTMADFCARRVANHAAATVPDGEPCSTAFAMRATASKKAAPKTEAKA